MARGAPGDEGITAESLQEIDLAVHFWQLNLVGRLDERLSFRWHDGLRGRRLGSLGEGEGPSLFREQARDGVANALGGLGAHLRDSIKAADLNINVGQLLGQCAGVGAVVAIGGLVLLGPTGLVLGPLASLAPYALVRKAGADRARALLEQLPDTLDLMARSLQAGVGLSDSFKLVAEEMPMPIAGEFGRIFEEIRFLSAANDRVAGADGLGHSFDFWAAKVRMDARAIQTRRLFQPFSVDRLRSRTVAQDQGGGRSIAGRHCTKSPP